MTQSRAECNELNSHGEELAVLYRGGKMQYKCLCRDDEYYPSHVKWVNHWQSTVNLPFTYVCFFCELRQPSIRSMAQHSIRCVSRTNSQMDMVTQGDSAQSVENVSTLIKCPSCDNDKRYIKSGLAYHIHRKHPQYFYDKYSNKRLRDRRWGPGEAKVLAKVLLEHLRRKRLPVDNNSIHDNLRECYLENKHKFSKSFNQIQILWASGNLKRELENQRNKVRLSKRINAATVNCNDDSDCGCTTNIYRVLNAATRCREALPGVGKRLRQTIRRELNSQQPFKGTHLLKLVYKHYGKKTEGGRQDIETSTQQPTSGDNDTGTCDDELYKSLKAKRYINHLEQPGLRHLAPSDEAIKWFGSQFERPSIDDNEPFEIIKDKAKSTCQLHAMIGDAEVELHAKTFDSNTASGTDGFTVIHLKSTPTPLLAILMNLFMLARDVPKALKVNRTTLLAKKPNPGPTEWRPITVSSVLYRLFSKIITKRLAAEIYISPYQRAFTNKIDGCLENSSTIGELIRRANGRGENSELYVCSLDLAKAFDSVSFTSIVRMLRRQRVDSKSLELLTNMLYGNVTIVSKQQESKITRGVRQGDPISPLLFNGVIDELFEYLKNDKYGASYTRRDGGQAKIVAVAFADDITLLCNSRWHLEKLLKISTEFFTRRGMDINIRKSSCLAIRRLPNKDVCTPLPVTIEVVNPNTGTREKLPCIGPEDDLRILGTYITPLGKPLIRLNELGNVLSLIERSSLSAHFKIELIRNHVAFKFRFRVVYGKVGQTTAGLADKMIRNSVRRILDLPKHTTQPFFHLPMSMGGLGIESLEFASQFLRTKMELKMLRNEREPTRELVRVSGLRDSLLRLSREMGFGMSMTKADFGLSGESIARELRELVEPDEWYDTCRRTWQSNQLDIIQTTAQGAVFKHITSAPLDYISRPERYKMEISKLPMVYRLRLGLDNLKGNIRGNVCMSKCCRLCLKGRNKEASETSMHVLQRCPYTKRWRIERHNAIVSLLYKELLSRLNGEHVYIRREQEFVLGSNIGIQVRLKPDLIIVCRNTESGSMGKTRISILEITCAYESLHVSSLKVAYGRKRRKYDVLKDYLSSENNLTMLKECAGGSCRLTMEGRRGHSNVEVAIHPFVVGTRGGWIDSNTDVWKFLSLQPKKLLMNRAYRTSQERSINVVKKFLGRVRAADEQQSSAIEM